MVYSARFRDEGRVILKTLNHDEVVIDARRSQPGQNQQDLKHKHNEDHQRKEHQVETECAFPYSCGPSIDTEDDCFDDPEGWEYVLNADQERIVFADAPASMCAHCNVWNETRK